MKFIKSLYFWILTAFIGGCLLGIASPQTAILMEPLGSSFVKLLKIFIGPIVFLTVANGIAQTGCLKKLGKISLKAFAYFEVVSSIALLIGLFAASILKPGSAIHANVKLLDQQAVATFLEHAEHLSLLHFLQNCIPTSIVEPFIKGDMLQILLLAILFGSSLLVIGEYQAKTLLDAMDKLTQSFFKIINMIMYTAPIGVFGAMAYTLGKFGSHFLIPLLGLVGTFYLTGILFILGVLGLVAKISGFSLIRFLHYISAELLVVLGTSSSESALPQLLKKLEQLGCRRETVGVVVPMGYSFNLDGTNIYITLAALFIAQALGVDLSLGQQFALFTTAMLLSKGAAGVTGAGFITLAATLSVVPAIPAVGVVLVLGIDRFMSQGRSLINYIGNGVASIAISRWENEISVEQLQAALSTPSKNKKENDFVSGTIPQESPVS